MRFMIKRIGNADEIECGREILLEKDGDREWSIRRMKLMVTVEMSALPTVMENPVDFMKWVVVGRGSGYCFE